MDYINSHYDLSNVLPDWNKIPNMHRINSCNSYSVLTLISLYMLTVYNYKLSFSAYTTINNRGDLRYYSNRDYCGLINSQGDIHITHVKRNINDCFAKLDENENGIYGFNLSTGLEVLLKDSRYHRVRVFHDEIHNVIHIYTNRSPYTIQSETGIYSVLFRIIAAIPLFVTKLTKVSEVEDPKLDPALFKTAMTHSFESFSTPFVEAIKATETFKNLGDAIIHNCLKNIFTQQTESLKRTLRDTQAQIKSYENSLASYYKALKDTQITIAGLDTMGQSAEEQITEGIKVLKNAKVFSNFSYNGNYIFFDVDTLLDNFDEAAAKKIYDKADVDPLLKAVFVDRRFTLRSKTKITVNQTNFNGSISDDRNILGNPHLVHYNCWGSYTAPIKKALQFGNVIEMFMLIHNSARSFNVLDGPVTNALAEDIRNNYGFSKGNNVYDPKTDTFITFSAAREIYKKEMENVNETN